MQAVEVLRKVERLLVVAADDRDNCLLPAAYRRRVALVDLTLESPRVGVSPRAIDSSAEQPVVIVGDTVGGAPDEDVVPGMDG